jgi:hypothetical protein
MFGERGPQINPLDMIATALPRSFSPFTADDV